MIKATHVMKNRQRRTCGLCHSPVLIGSLIVRVGATGSWLHLTCFRSWKNRTNQRGTIT